MDVQGIAWLGIRTDRFAETVEFFARAMNLRQTQQSADFAEFKLPNGDTVEVFGPGDTEHDQFTTGPVVGFRVSDVEEAARELEAAGVERLSSVDRGAGMAWAHFRGPDGNVYELTQIEGPMADLPA